ncbi:hypothetical protein SO802_011064 [Lithocarpus litseifolius]|uniref:Protein kinase domain-containing protein n=1 Tax=Lithocarpus litseifolius TaxID=425828 RepID=A0AAW2DG01_9ROSI
MTLFFQTQNPKKEEEEYLISLSRCVHFEQQVEKTSISMASTSTSTSTSSSSSRSSSILDDPSNPLYLHHEESPGAMLVYQPLVGENYPTWARSMRMALIAKNKLGFIDGTLTLSSPMVKTPSTIQAWIRCNKMVASWILNSVSQEIATSIIYTALEIWNNLKERLSQRNGLRIFQLQKDIVGITQGQSSITSYFTQLKVLWDELQNVQPFPVCSCGSCTCNLGQKLSDLQHQDLVMQFLMGLNESYSQVRAQILLMDPLPSINEVYSFLIQEERECSVEKNLDLAGNNNNKNSKGKNNSTCNHCGMMGHIVEKCYKIYGYPPSFRPKGKKSTMVHQVNLQDEQVEKNSTSASTSFSFTQEQCQQSLAMLGTQIQSVNFDFANKEVHMANNVIQPATHSTFMAVVVIKRAEISKSKPYESYVNDCGYHDKKLEALSRLSHKNLIRFLGFCEDNNERVLVYDYMKYGNLDDHLHKHPSTPLMSWAARIRMALDIARGIEYLHVYAVPPIIHRDIKTSNILLDATWTAKVTDFGLSLMAPMDAESPLSLLAAGTVGYIDPEYYRLQRLTTKSDVYSFGVVLLEMLSGYKAIHWDENGVPWNVADFVVPYIVQDEIQKVLDPKVPPPTPFEIEAVAYVGYLAVDCVSPEGLNRPSMTEIVKRLQSALDACVDPDAE